MKSVLIVILLATVVCVHSTFLGARRLRSSPSSSAVEEDAVERKERVRAQHVARFFGSEYSSSVPEPTTSNAANAAPAKPGDPKPAILLRSNPDLEKSPVSVHEGMPLTPNQIGADKVFTREKTPRADISHLPPIFDGPHPLPNQTTTTTTEKPAFRYVLPPGAREPEPLPAPVAPPREKFTYVTEDYALFDKYHNRGLSFFDPEYYVMAYPYYVFPYELDIPFGWAIYNPVTVQAPKPLPERSMRSVRYSGFYYACPKWANPFDYSWFFDKEEQNPCKWIWYQTRQDQLLRE